MDPPPPVIVTIRDNRDYIRVLLYSCYTTITGWGVLLRYLMTTATLRTWLCREHLPAFASDFVEAMLLLA